MLKQLHILLTYTCTLTCEHCFVCSSPGAQGTFSLSQLMQILDQAANVETIDTIYFEGGEPFLFYPLLLEGIRNANELGFNVGIVTNAFFATSEENAELFLRPLTFMKITDLSISNDVFHRGEEMENPAEYAYLAAKKLGLPVMYLNLDPGGSGPDAVGSPRDAKMGIVQNGGIMFRGRAAFRLTRYATLHDWHGCTSCPYENLASPERVHVDVYGNVQICQGISIGNIWKKPLKDIVREYHAADHAICGPLIRGGPVELARELSYKPPAKTADACHVCFLARESALDRYPEILCPKQVYQNES